MSKATIIITIVVLMHVFTGVALAVSNESDPFSPGNAKLAYDNLSPEAKTMLIEIMVLVTQMIVYYDYYIKSLCISLFI